MIYRWTFNIFVKRKSIELSTYINWLCPGCHNFRWHLTNFSLTVKLKIVDYSMIKRKLIELFTNIDWILINFKKSRWNLTNLSLKVKIIIVAFSNLFNKNSLRAQQHLNWSWVIFISIFVRKSTIIGFLCFAVLMSLFLASLSLNFVHHLCLGIPSCMPRDAIKQKEKKKREWGRKRDNYYQLLNYNTEHRNCKIWYQITFLLPDLTQSMIQKSVF